MAAFDEEDLFAEASEELRDDVRDAVMETRDALPGPEELLAVEDDELTAVLDGVRAELAADEVAAALETARKRFVIGYRAEAFDAAFVEQMEGELAALRDGVAAVRDAADAADTLSGAVATVRLVQAEEENGEGAAGDGGEGEGGVAGGCMVRYGEPGMTVADRVVSADGQRRVSIGLFVWRVDSGRSLLGCGVRCAGETGKWVACHEGV